MMAVISQSAFPAAMSRWYRASEAEGGGSVVVAKVTFDLQSGRARLAEHQQAVRSLYADDRVGLSLGDLAPFKGFAEVIVIPRADAAGKRVRLELGPQSRRIDVRPRAPSEEANVAARRSLLADIGDVQRGLSRGVFPAGIDPSFFNSAPEHQWVRSLEPLDRLLVWEIERDGAPTITALPGVRPHGTVNLGGHISALGFRADTLLLDLERGFGVVVWRAWIESDEGRPNVEIQWRSAAPSSAPDRAAREPTSVPQRAGGQESPELCRDEQGSPCWDSKMVTQSIRSLPREILPFREGSVGSSGRSAVGESNRSNPMYRSKRSKSAIHATSPGAAGAVTTPSEEGQVTRPVRLPTRAVLPFGASLAASLEEEATVETPACAPSNARHGHYADALFQPPIQHGPEYVPWVAPPALLWVPPKPEVAASEPPTFLTPVVDLAPEKAELVDVVGSEGIAELRGREPKDLSLEACARLEAEIALAEDEVSVLTREDVTPEERRQAETAHQAKIRSEARAGRSALMLAYDAAFVARLEELRGAISAAEYARLAVARERGQLREVARDLRLPASGIMRVERVSMRRMAADDALLFRFQAETAKARAEA
jgi:hypothetical protein